MLCELALSQSTKNNYYKFDAEIEKSINKGINSLKKLSKRFNVQTMFLLLERSQGNTVFSISNCQQCVFSSVIKSSNKFFYTDFKTQIPSINEFDLKYDKTFNSGKGDKPIAVLINGYKIEVDKNGKIISEGLEQ